MSDIISRREVLALAEKGVLVSNGNYKSVCKAINDIPPIEEKEGVRIIWQHQIDDLIKQIKAESLGKWYTGRIDGKTDEVVLLKDVIEILEEAKK